MKTFDHSKIHDKAEIIYEVLLIYCDKSNEIGIGGDFSDGVVAGYKVALALFEKTLPPLEKVHLATGDDPIAETLKYTLDKALNWALESFNADTDDTFPDGFHAFAEQLAMIYSNLS